MPEVSRARIMRLHFSETDKYEGRPLYEALLERCRAMKIAGATVFRGLEGYGETAEVHKHHLVTHDEPIVLVVVDTAENIDRLLPVVEEMIYTGMIAVSDVDMIRVQKPR